MTSEPAATRSLQLRWTLRILRLAFAVALTMLILLVGCQSQFIYFPRPYGPATVTDWQQATAGKTIDYQTSQGPQRSFLQGNLKSPRNLWIVCGGNGTVALDWSEWIDLHAPKEDAWLLVDFPGYGDCKGAPSPEGIRENLAAATPLACQELGWPDHPDPARLRFFGHSLGAAACLIASSEFKIQRGVLIAPFTSTMEMSRVMTGLPMGFLIWHRFDNSARLAELAARGPGDVIILHGAEDESIPVMMSRTLASQRKDAVRLIEIPDGRHNTIQATNTREVADALMKIGRDPLKER